MHKNVIIFFLVIRSVCFYPQIKRMDSANVSQKIEFSRYLIRKNKILESTLVLSAINKESLPDNQKDSVSYFLGITSLLLKNETEADTHFNSITDTTGKLYFLRTAAKNFYSLKNFGKVSVPVQSPKDKSDLYFFDLFRLQLLAYHLLRNNPVAFKLVYDKKKCETEVLMETEQKLYQYYTEMIRIPKKKQWKAVVLSAMIPGLGKLYAGKRGEALTAFLPVFTNGAQALEGYTKAGTNSPHLYIFGGIGTVFYFSNLYGAKQAVKRSIDERHEQIHLAVHEQLHFLDTGFY